MQELENKLSLKQLQPKKSRSTNRRSGSQSTPKTIPSLVVRLLGDRTKVALLQTQVRGSPLLVNFLYTLLEKDYRDNIFTDGYGENRAFADGQATEAEKIYMLLKELENGHIDSS